MKSRFFHKFIFIFFLVGCATSPTGRRQLMLLPESQMATMGAQAFDETKRKTPIETDSRTNAYVKCVADPILKTAGAVEGVSAWEIVVFRDNQINAFALPGGRIGVYTGMFKAAQNSEQLAAVLAHEVGHVIAKHGNERVSETFVVSGGLELLNAATQKGNKNHGLLMGALGLGAQFGVLLPHGRSQESEADSIGLDLMAKAGFDPQQSIQLWQNMAKAAGGSPPEFMSTHPSHGTRINNLSKNMPPALAKFQTREQSGELPKCKL